MEKTTASTGKNSAAMDCPRCNGTGWIYTDPKVAQAAATPSGGTASTGKCPFCGGEGVLLSTHDIPRNQYLWVQCNDCGGQGPRFKCYGEDALGRDKAWETWKRRVAEIPSGVGAKWTEIWNQANKVCALSGAVANDCDHHGITRPTWWKAVKKLQKLINSADAHNACLK